jgi:UDP-3-O-[3-hydroxymyristoyl] glucosamine N-acyltransferase
MQATLQQIAQLINGQVNGDPNTVITGPCKIESGFAGGISFLSNPKYKEYIYDTAASAVMVSDDFVAERPISTNLLKVKNVYEALGKLLAHFGSSLSLEEGVAASAIVHSTAKLGNQVSLGNFTIIGPQTSIGNGTKIYDQVFVGDQVELGQDCVLYPGVKIYHNCKIGDRVIIHANTVIGSDGFGFAPSEDGSYHKIEQTGNVVIGNDVEIGSNCTIDRATLGSTEIHDGVKLDNLIQVAHNVSIGKNTVIAAQAGIAGSTKVGAQCIIGGQVGMVGHITIANGTMIQAQTGVASSVKEPNSKLYGYPAMDYQSYLKSYAYFRKLPDTAKEIRQLQEEVKRLKENLNQS